MATDTYARVLAMKAIGGGGGGEPAKYLQDAKLTEEDQKLVITKKDGSKIEFRPIPKFAVSDKDKVLTVSDDGTEIEWAESQGIKVVDVDLSTKLSDLPKGLMLGRFMGQILGYAWTFSTGVILSTGGEIKYCAYRKNDGTDCTLQDLYVQNHSQFALVRNNQWKISITEDRLYLEAYEGAQRNNHNATTGDMITFVGPVDVAAGQTIGEIVVDGRGCLVNEPFKFNPDQTYEFVMVRGQWRRFSEYDLYDRLVKGEGKRAVVGGDITVNTAEGDNSLSFGVSAHAKGDVSFAFGTEVGAMAPNAFATGNLSQANGQASVAMGQGAKADGEGSHAEGSYTNAKGKSSHAEGEGTTATAANQHVQGSYNVVDVDLKYADIIGGGADKSSLANIEATDWQGNKYLKGDVFVECDEQSENGKKLIPIPEYTLADETKTLQVIKKDEEAALAWVEGGGDFPLADRLGKGKDGDDVVEGAVVMNCLDNEATGLYSTAEGFYTMAHGNNSHAEGSGNFAEGVCSHAEGSQTTAEGENAHAEGNSTEAMGDCSHAEGQDTHANAMWSHTEGYQTTTDGMYAHAEGNNTKAGGQCAHAEGANTKADGKFAHAEGRMTQAMGDQTHAEGMGSTATAAAAHAEGMGAKANGQASHAEGQGAEANGSTTHAEGYGTLAASANQHVQGKYNVGDVAGDFADIIGNGTSTTERKNIEATSWTGNKYLAGDVYVECDDESKNGKKLEPLPEYAVAEDGKSLTVVKQDDNTVKLEWVESGFPLADRLFKGNGQGAVVIGSSANMAEGEDSVAEGMMAYALGDCTHAEGIATMAFGQASHVEGFSTVVGENNYYQHVQGKYNVKDETNQYADIVGGGGAEDTRKNISSLTWTGDLHLKGDVYVGANDDGTGGTKLGEGGGDFPLADRMAKGTKDGSVVIGDIEDGKATGEYALAEGVESEAKGGGSHAEGQATLAKGNYSHTEGSHTIASSNLQHVQGKYNVEDTLNTFADIVGNGANADNRKNIEATDWNGNKYLKGGLYLGCGDDSTGNNYIKPGVDSDGNIVQGAIVLGGDDSYGLSCQAKAPYALAEGQGTVAKGEASHAEGQETHALDLWTHAEGRYTQATGRGAHAEGISTQASGWDAHSEGLTTIASGEASHAEGSHTEATGYGSHAENGYSKATGLYSHAEGENTISSDEASHAEGIETNANGAASHAEGNHTVANTNCAHAEGSNTEAGGEYSHAEGLETKTVGLGAHAEGVGTVAQSSVQHVQGRYNIEDGEEIYADIVGGGESDSERKNISSLTWDGNLHLKGDIFVGANDDGTGGIALGDLLAQIKEILNL